MSHTTYVEPAPVLIMKGIQAPKMALEMLTGGLAVGVATCMTSPIDIVKVRIQLAAADGQKVNSIIRTGVDVVKLEGIAALWKGLLPAVSRGFLYGGIRLGMYGPVQQAMCKEGEKITLGGKIAAGSFSGAVAAVLTNPTDLVKTRLQASGCAVSGTWPMAQHIMRKEGLQGLWHGTMPSALRAGVLTASQCASYDVVKRLVLESSGWGDQPATHMTSSMITGLIVTTTTSPVDVMKTRMFMGGKNNTFVNCASGIYAQEGLRGFFRGWTANYARLGPQTMITFMCAEQLRAAAGLSSM